MVDKIRKTPVVCLTISIVKLLFGRIRLTKNYLQNIIQMNDESKLVIFRHITSYPLIQADGECVFIVSFKFAHLSHKANKLTSIFPMLMIAGFPGFIAKIYAVNQDDGYWQGMYQWKSVENLEDYKKSFVFKMMNKRAITDSITSMEIMNKSLIEFIEAHKIKK
jgi:hypothetical protein